MNAVLKVFSTVYPKHFETTRDLMARVAEFKKYLRSLNEEKVAVVAHKNFLKAFTAEGVNEDGKLIDPITFENC